MSISIPDGTVRKAVILVAAPFVLAALLLLVSCATDDAPTLCSGSASYPDEDDPYIQMLVREGLSLRDAQVKASINRINGCP